jgi:ATP-binding protein involved in chromosome partitioning
MLASRVGHGVRATSMTAPDEPRESHPDPDDTIDQPQQFAGAHRLLAIASGKGVVGKSTVAVNLALGLTQLGYRVGLLDADVHGPNVPLMLGVRRRAVAAGWESIVPLAMASPQTVQLPALERYGVRIMSLGLLAGEEQALLTDNAPLVGLLVRGLLTLVDWGDPDVLLMDLPPGTGEPLATLLRTVRFDGVVLVTTPQDVARLDAGRVLAAFREAHVPVLGTVENMAYLVCPHCGERIEVFHRSRVSRSVDAGSDGGVPRLAEIPLDPALSEAADTGRPVLIADPDGAQARAFVALAAAVTQRLEMPLPSASE